MVSSTSAVVYNGQRAQVERRLINLALGVDQIQRGFEALKRHIEERKGRQLFTTVVELIIQQAFIEDELRVPKHLTRQVHDLYFNPQ
jgi:hypothetical protein